MSVVSRRKKKSELLPIERIDEMVRLLVRMQEEDRYEAAHFVESDLFKGVWERVKRDEQK